MFASDPAGEWWRVRVDLFAAGGDERRHLAAQRNLTELLTAGVAGGKTDHVGADLGLGIEKRPVVGLLFWVRASNVGEAAVLAVDTARHACEGTGVGPELYDVTVIPEAAVAQPDADRYPAMPD